MKCVKELSTDSITRVNDEKAQSLIKKDTHVYVSKELWKRSQIPKLNGIVKLLSGKPQNGDKEGKK